MEKLTKLQLNSGLVKIASKFTTSKKSYALEGINIVKNSVHFGGSDELVCCDGYKVIFIKEDEIDPEKTISDLYNTLYKYETESESSPIFHFEFYNRWKNRANIYVKESDILSPTMEAKVSNSQYINCINDMETVSSDKLFINARYPNFSRVFLSDEFYESTTNCHELCIKVNDVLNIINSYISTLKKRISNNSLLKGKKGKSISNIQTCIRCTNFTNGVTFSTNVYRLGLVNEDAETPFEDAFEVRFGGVINTDKLKNLKHANDIVACIDLIQFKDVLEAFKVLKVREVSIKIPCTGNEIVNAIRFTPEEYQGIQSFAYLMPMNIKDK